MSDPVSGEITAIIPAAGRVPESVLALSNISCPAMIPVAGRPVIYWTMSYLIGLGVSRFIVAVPERGLFIEDFVPCSFGDQVEVEFIVPSEDRGVGGTILDLLDKVETSRALVVLGDTHFQFDDPAVLEQAEPFVLVHPVEESYRWCIARSDDQGRVLAFEDKLPDLEGNLRALIGVYYLPNLADARAAASRALEVGQGRAELAGMLSNLAGEINAIDAGEWLDCGNPDRQASSHRSLLQKRAFNHLSVDPTLGTITKSSEYVEKFINEVNYLRLMPRELRVLFPRIVDYSIEWDKPFVSMEYYGYPTLSEIFVFENVDPGAWERIFQHVRDILTDVLMKRTRPLQASTLKNMYLDKTRARVDQLLDSSDLPDIYTSTGPILINGREYQSLAMLWPALEEEIGSLSRNAAGGIIHGDLCFSNILYDLRAGVCKLIDPRGSFGDVGIFGDPRYDVAKLYHSAYGLYDFIVNDLFQVESEGREATLKLLARPTATQIRERFEQVFFPTFDRREILLLTALLFISMPALHYDYPRRQLAMFLRGTQLLNEALELPRA